jgi:hypothetical protein
MVLREDLHAFLAHARGKRGATGPTSRTGQPANPGGY